jgi:tetratricopeptide (TPR) repeat protein
MDKARLSEGATARELAAQAAERYRAAAVPGYARLDEALLGLGDALAEAGEIPSALAAWRRLVKEVPDSRVAPDAWLSIGAALQDGASPSAEVLAEARDALVKAVAGRAQTLATARYRLGLCHIGLGDLDLGMEQLAKAMALAEEEGDAELAADATREYVSAYGRAGDPRRAIAELRKVSGPERSWSMLKELAELYYDTGRTADATRLFHQLLKDRPLSPDAPHFRYRLLGYLVRDGDKPQIVAEVKELAKAIQAIRREGQFARPEDQRAFSLAQERTDALLSTLSTTWHEASQASGDATAVTLAAQLCNLYLALFPDAQAPDIRRCSEGS